MKKRQVVLIVLDGWGYREDPQDNAIASSLKPNFDRYWNNYPHSLLKAHGYAVGLPDTQMGNSEVGHTTIGAGKVIDTDLVKINKSIETGEFDSNQVLQNCFSAVKDNNTLHLIGLLGDGGVHAYSEHLLAAMRLAKKLNVKKVALHLFLDGRDTPPQSAAEFIKPVMKLAEELGNVQIASLTGRFYGMDRDNNWDRVKQAEDAIFEANATQVDLKPDAALVARYQQNEIDEHIKPMLFKTDSGYGCKVQNGDSVFFLNFRADRARQLSQRILLKQKELNLNFASMTPYGSEFSMPAAFILDKITSTLAKEISAAGLTQAHIAETEKFPHATYFLNGGVEAPYPGERHIMLASRKDVPTHDLAPKMRAFDIAEKAIAEIENNTDFIFINFANPDMVGHTANVPAIISAIEEVDLQLGRVVDCLLKRNGIAFITADHGNAEVNRDPITGAKHTSHTINPVPAILTDKNYKLNSGGLADIAPSILELFEIKLPAAMTGISLLTK